MFFGSLCFFVASPHQMDKGLVGGKCLGKKKTKSNLEKSISVELVTLFVASFEGQTKTSLRSIISILGALV